MNYRNAQDIFPENLLKQIQRYVSGETIYIPAKNEKKAWGESSGYRAYLAKRNQSMKEDFADGLTIEELSEKYCLSFDSVKHIVYTKQEYVMLNYNKTLSSALSYAKENKIDEWIHAYLHDAEKSNIPFSDGLKLFERYYIGPIKMPTDLFERNTGPEEGMKYKIDKDWWPIHVAALEDSIKKDPDMPPLIAHYVEHGFEMNDGNTRLQAYKNLGVQEVSIIIWITEQEEYEEFMSRYGNYAEGAPVIRR